MRSRDDNNEMHLNKRQKRTQNADETVIPEFDVNDFSALTEEEMLEALTNVEVDVAPEQNLQIVPPIHSETLSNEKEPSRILSKIIIYYDNEDKYLNHAKSIRNKLTNKKVVYSIVQSIQTLTIEITLRNQTKIDDVKDILNYLYMEINAVKVEPVYEGSQQQPQNPPKNKILAIILPHNIDIRAMDSIRRSLAKEFVQYIHTQKQFRSNYFMLVYFKVDVVADVLDAVIPYLRTNNKHGSKVNFQWIDDPDKFIAQQQEVENSCEYDTNTNIPEFNANDFSMLTEEEMLETFRSVEANLNKNPNLKPLSNTNKAMLTEVEYDSLNDIKDPKGLVVYFKKGDRQNCVDVARFLQGYSFLIREMRSGSVKNALIVIFKENVILAALTPLIEALSASRETNKIKNLTFILDVDVFLKSLNVDNEQIIATKPDLILYFQNVKLLTHELPRVNEYFSDNFNGSRLNTNKEDVDAKITIYLNENHVTCESLKKLVKYLNKCHLNYVFSNDILAAILISVKKPIVSNTTRPSQSTEVIQSTSSSDIPNNSLQNVIAPTKFLSKIVIYFDNENDFRANDRVVRYRSQNVNNVVSVVQRLHTCTFEVTFRQNTTEEDIASLLNFLTTRTNAVKIDKFYHKENENEPVILDKPQQTRHNVDAIPVVTTQSFTLWQPRATTLIDNKGEIDLNILNDQNAVNDVLDEINMSSTRNTQN